MGLKKHHDFMLDYSKSLLFRIIKRPAFIFLGITTFTIMTAFSLAIYFIEGANNPQFDSVLNSVYFTVSTMTSVGFGDVTPSTTLGKLIAMAMMLLGTFIYVSFTGVVAATVLELELEVKQKE